jgi:hypothetical protein
MSAKDAIHDAVRNALVKDGWTITEDPYRIRYQGDKLYADLAAEKVIAAERGPDRIAVEIKSFGGPSVLHEFEQAMGQLLLYQTVMEETDPGRRVVLGVSDIGYKALRNKPSAVLTLERRRVPVVVIAVDTEEVIRWTS